MKDKWMANASWSWWCRYGHSSSYVQIDCAPSTRCEPNRMSESDMWEAQYNNQPKTKQKDRALKRRWWWKKKGRITRSFVIFCDALFFIYSFDFMIKCRNIQTIRRTNNRAAIFKWITEDEKKNRHTHQIAKAKKKKISRITTTTTTLSKCSAIRKQRCWFVIFIILLFNFWAMLENVFNVCMHAAPAHNMWYIHHFHNNYGYDFYFFSTCSFCFFFVLFFWGDCLVISLLSAVALLVGYWPDCLRYCSASHIYSVIFFLRYVR